MAEITYIQAISEGLREEMQRDESVFLLGEDIGNYGGAFKVTKGFVEEFGEERVIDTPLAESAIFGMSIGAALQDMRPVAEMQFSDFVSTGFNQLVNNAAKIHYRWGAAVPMTVRMPTGGGVHGGPFHSQNTEAWFFHVPGLKLVAPSNPYDAKGLIKAAIRDKNPVLYFEHKYLYRREKQELSGDDFLVEIGKGRVAREGEDLTVLTYGSMVPTSLEAASHLESRIDVEVIDLRSLMPLDMELIIGSIKKTNKALIVHEDIKTGGIGAELSARITEEAFEWLDGPIRRVASIDTPVPFAPSLEEYFMPNPDKIAAGIQQLWDY
ncbi:MAG: 2-oxoisovalerate dehydrogenase subunit beta [Candidatus Marinimicrobia bacterium]|nr:2-oxoisovalerate dehydrogenase subunit beta [Candidatus Neomarinimicrobiota bacterium]